MRQTTIQSIELLRELVRVPSESFSEEAACSLISSRLNAWGIPHKLVGRNIVAFNRMFDQSLPTLAFDAHIDTVPPASTYTRDPYDPGHDPDIVWGLGSNDDGGSVVAMIAAFRELYDRKMPLNVALVLNSEEERSGTQGAMMLYGPDGPEEMKSVKWVVLGEPTGMKAATSERGLLVLDAEARGVSGHAARNEGVNAIYIALSDIEALLSHKFTEISPIMGDVRLTVTQIQAGTAHNVVPDSCTFVVDIRPTEQYTNEEILAELQGICRSTLKPRNLLNRSSATPPGSLLIRSVEELGIGMFSSPTTSNWMRIRDREGVKMGPGESSRSHHADEYILCSEIADAVEKYIKFAENFYGHTLE